MKEHPSADVLDFCKTLHDPDSLELSMCSSSAKVSPQPPNEDNQSCEVFTEENSPKPVPVDGCETQLPDESENKDINITSKDDATINAKTEPNSSAIGDEAVGETLSVLSNNSKEVS